MGEISIPAEVLAELRKRHVAFLRERLASETAREDWTRAAARGWDELLALRVRDVVDARAASQAIVRALDAEAVRGFFAPVLREVARETISVLQSDATELGEYVPADARKAIDELLERHDLIPDALVRKVFEQKVVEDAIQNTLYDALTQFQSTVNPFFAEWGLPSIVKRLPIGGSMILASMETIRAEFDKRVEPEIRKFLAVFSRRTQGELAELFLSRSGDPKLAQLRKDVVAYLYTRPVEELVAGVDEEMTGTSALVTERIALTLLARRESSEALEAALERLLDEHGGLTIGEWLERLGAVRDPGVEAWAGLSWPLARGVLASDAVAELLERLTAEFYDSL